MNPDAFPDVLIEVGDLVRRNQVNIADERLRELLKTHDVEVIRTNEGAIRAIIAMFLPKRRRDLTSAMDAAIVDKPPALSEDVVTRPVPITSLEAFRRQFRDELNRLSASKLFQWAAFYRDVFTRTLDSAVHNANDPAMFAAICSILVDEASAHATEIYQKGYSYTTVQGHWPIDAALPRSASGLAPFLALPIEYYSSNAFNVVSGAEARTLRTVCSAVTAGIILGFSRAQFGGKSGSALLPRFPRAWLHVTPFLTAHDAQKIAHALEEGDLRHGLETTLSPILFAIDRLMEEQQGEEFCLPRLGQFAWENRRIELAMTLPRGATERRYFEIHAYLIPAFLRREQLEESVNRGVNIVAGELRPDLVDWLSAHGTALMTVINTTEVAYGYIEPAVARTINALTTEIARLAGRAAYSQPVTVNLAELFPLRNPFLTRYFLVHRTSVRALLKTFEHDTGVRLWNSIRRSGKTTACFDLSSTGGQTVVVTQTMDDTEQYADANQFFEAFTHALDAGRQLPRDFFKQTVAACLREARGPDSKIIFVLDEYETLFERLRLAAVRDVELRYKIVQPLLNQIVAFSKDNLVILVGQRPDAYYILMDQNQLSAYVRQDPFPLFAHIPNTDQPTEFTEFVKKVMTEWVRFDSGFADAVYGETGGHPYLTVNSG